MSALDVLEKYATLAGNVETLKNDMRAVKETLADFRDRIVRLEGGAELTAEKAKNAALASVTVVTFQLQKEIAILQAQLLGRDGTVPTLQIPRPLEGSGKKDSQ